MTGGDAGAEEPAWTVRSRRTLHVGPVPFDEDEVELPSGRTMRYAVDRAVPFAAAVLLVETPDRLVLTRQYRHPLGRWILDLPGGAGRAGETAEDAARRECEEEVGLVPTRLTPLSTVFPNPGRAAWPVHLFLGSDPRPGARVVDDETERIRAVTMSPVQLDRLIADGDIVDPALLLARFFAAARRLLPPVAFG